MRVVPRKSLVEARPVELWHLEIAQDEVVRFGAQLLQGGAAVGRDVHAVVVEPEKIRQRLRDVGLIVHHEDRLALNRRQGLERPCFRKSRRYGDRQLDAKDRALPRPAVDLNRPSVSDDDRPAQPEPQAGPVPWRLRREEGLENSRLDLRGDPGARVGALESYAFFLSTGPRRHGEPTRAWHSPRHSGEDLRAVFYDQTPRPGHGPWAVALPWDHRRAWRHARRRERARTRGDLPDRASAPHPARFGPRSRLAAARPSRERAEAHSRRR